MELQFQIERHAVVILMIICVLFCNTGNLFSAAQNESVVNIGVILNYNSAVGKVAKTAIKMAGDDINRDTNILNGSRLVLHFRDSRGEAIQGASAGLDLLEMEVVAIIGPQASEVAEFILHLGTVTQVPVVSFSVTNPSLSHHRFPYFVRMTHSDALQMRPIAALAQAYGWRRVTAVYSEEELGSGSVFSLSDALREVGSELENIVVISLNADQETIGEELYKLKTMESRVFVVHMQSDLASKVLMGANQIGMMDNGYVWITTNEFTSLWDDIQLNYSTRASMHGLLGVKNHIQKSNKHGDFTRRWRSQKKAELNAYCLFAYDAVWMIARAIGNLGNTTFNFRKSTTSTSFDVGNTTDLTDLKMFQEGPQLLQELLKTDFSGVSGVVQLDDGEIVGSTYEIVNVVGNGYHVVGYWNDKTQLSKQLPSAASSGSGQNNIIHKLGAVIWPGGSTEVPRGWEQPTSGKRLKIGVPIKHGFTEFVKVEFDNSRNSSNVTGFCIDVFKAVVNKLDYALPYDLIPYGNKCRTEPYDDLTNQVYLKNFDAVVGDITILADRSKHIDFTQPFTASGLVMVVPLSEVNNAWVFVLPFTLGMWCTTGAFVIFTGFAIWLFEHRVNPEFRGKPRDQVVTLLWFSFSTLVFSHREKLVSSSSRLVLVIWLFAVLILTSSYTASLASMFTVKKLNPTLKDVDSLRASKAAVGFQEGTFVGEYLQKHLHIAKENLRSYTTLEEAGDSLSKGPKNGGVAAIFDEIPYIRIFLASQCNYTTVGPIYRTGGFGFVFPKRPPLLSDISRAILSLAEDKKIQEIEAMWLNSTVCTVSGDKMESKRLSMENFWGLYLITGTVSLIALIIFFSMLIYDYKRDPNVKGNDMGDPSTKKSLKKAM